MAIRSTRKTALRKRTAPPLFEGLVFHRGLIAKLPKKTASHWLKVLDGQAKFDPSHADCIAENLKDWALAAGATHFTHWFQPLSSRSAEKHDSFLSLGPKGTVLESFRGKDLLRAEPDASSFPSGGLRATHEARGYTAWDPTAYPFLWKSGEGVTLCLPALFFSWKGDALDYKIPLMRSEEKLSTVVLRLLKLCNVAAKTVFATLGVEQEYFAIDRSLFLLRPDLYLAGRTVFGSKPPKGQELEDHYFGTVKDRILAYMRDFEEAALQLGIPVKTRHNEVAPAQHEVAPLFEKASIAIDHNIQLMDLMHQIALKHDLACLLHEKPFMGINGSGKHNNWSLTTDAGLNLLDPRGHALHFAILLTAILRAVHEHAALLRASIGSAGNDHRLGGAEAPPTILSVYLGEELEAQVRAWIHGQTHAPSLKSVDLGLAALPRHITDASDRNRTSFFAFTGNKFEFRAVGSSANCALPITVIHAIVADSLHLILDEIDDVLKDRKLTHEKLFETILPVLRRHLKIAEPVLFSGDNYSEAWKEEAKKRNLPNIPKSFHAFSHFIDKKSIRIFDRILSAAELHSRYEILVEQYAKAMQIEVHLMVDLFQTQILPAAQKDMLQRGVEEPLIAKTISLCEQLKVLQSQTTDLGWEAKAQVYCELIEPQMLQFRSMVDALEMVVDNALWPLPKYRELLFLI